MVYGIDDLLLDVDSMIPDGGVENGMTAMLDALNLVNSIVYKHDIVNGLHNFIVLTDEDADDPELTDSVIDTATGAGNANVRIHFFFSGMYYHPQYDMVLKETNGFSVTEINAENLPAFVEFFLPEAPTDAPIVPMGRRKRASCEIFIINYFISSFKALVTSTTYISSFAFTKPDGSPESIEAFGNFAVYKDSEPQVGEWQVCGDVGTVSVTLATTSFLDFSVTYLRETDGNLLLPTSDFQFPCEFLYT